MKKWLLFFAFLNLILLSGCQAMQSASFAKNPTPIETTAPSSPTPEETRSEKYPPGQYLVGIDIPAGEYKLICEEEDWPGYYCVSTTALAKTGEIIANDIFYNMSYVFVEEGQYLKLERCYTEDSLRLVERPPQETEMIPSDSVTEINAISDPTPSPTPSLSPSDEDTLADSIFDEETAQKLDNAIEARKKRQFFLCLAQDDFEGYCWGQGSAFTGIWEEVYADNNFNGQYALQDIKNDLDLYLALGSSSYDALWIASEALYEAYDSGELKETMEEDQYQNLIDTLNAVSKRLGILYDRPEYIPQSEEGES